MKFRNLSKWSDPKKLEGLLFFAQLVEELLFDYSLDTYKPSAMNSSTLCLEALRLIDDIDAGLMDASNLKHVAEELIYNLRRDEVAKNLLSVPIDNLESKLTNEGLSNHEKRVYIELVRWEIDLPKYKEINESLLSDAVRNANKKDRIRSLARSYITTLISIGYHPSYLYPTARKFFFLGSVSIEQPDDIWSFFSQFPLENQKYVAIFRAQSIFREIESSCHALDVEIHNTVSEEFDTYIQKKDFDLEPGKVYVVVKDFPARDVHSARIRAQRELEFISNLASMFHHKNVPSWDSHALLINMERERPRVVHAPKNPMLKCADLRTKNAASRLNKFISNFSLSEKRSFERFDRSAELHAMALKTDAPENQLLNLWVSLETLVPSEAGSGRAKINNIVESVLPFLIVTYIPNLLERLRRDIAIWKRGVLTRAVKGIEGPNEVGKLARVLSVEDYADRRRTLLSECDDFYLLRNRIYYFQETLKSTSHVNRLLLKHRKRVEWQIRRIYRARNSVVHAGIAPPITEALIENLHDYVDIVTDKIIRLASDGQTVNTLDQAFKHTSLRCEAYLGSLAEDNRPVSEERVDWLLFAGYEKAND